ncbi:hypothetical protein DYU05_18740 [Mucilaginibacter terrenus]|uniref:GIY-YIG domain-containing protein n=1 Tax=Mucilaginibacter terrenus TaxID=2482727 RepID=A0A3E2NLJ5_9SPHI|nr:hypothetical protein DYU05_18740 [Mucilaginibacter terrenus]
MPYKQRVTGSNPVAPTKPHRNARLFFYVYCYILYSPSSNKHYIGFCQDIDERLRKHHTAHKGFTGSKADWNLKWTEIQPDKTSALK